MVSIVWLILSLFKVCAFTWLPVFIESALLTLILLIAIVAGDSDSAWGVLFPFTGVLTFSIYKCFFGLAISNWWVLLSPIAASIILFLPGGFTAFNLLFNHFGLTMVPQWAVITGIVLDVVKLIFIIIGVSKKKLNVYKTSESFGYVFNTLGISSNQRRKSIYGQQ